MITRLLVGLIYIVMSMSFNNSINPSLTRLEQSLQLLRMSFLLLFHLDVFNINLICCMDMLLFFMCDLSIVHIVIALDNLMSKCINVSQTWHAVLFGSPN
jgi:hypothetical protein